MANIKFTNALNKVPQSVPPIWMMRQAGRYHAPYQELRKKYSFMDLCKMPEVAAETAMGPIRDFDFDVAILFSDLLFPLEALGMGLKYEETGPKLGWQLTPQNLNQLYSVEKALPALMFQKDAVQATRSVLPEDKSLIGFVGGAWTLFAYAVDGSHKGSLTKSKQYLNMYADYSKVMLPLLEQNIQLQLDGGAEIVLMIDTAAGELSPDLFQQMVVPQLKSFAQKFPGKIGYYSKGTQPCYFGDDFFQSGMLAGRGVDHRWDMSSLLSHNKAGFLQGNMDQTLLFLDPPAFKEYLLRWLEPMRKLSPTERAGWVCGLGHGILPQTPTQNVRTFVETVREVFR